MAAEHYEMSGSVSDALRDAAQASPSFNVYEPSDWSYYSLSNSSAYQHLPEITIDDIRTTVSDVLREDRAARIFNAAGEKSEKVKLIGKRNEILFSENADGTYTHIAQKGDTYWDVARAVVMAQAGAKDPADVKDSDIQKMTNKLLRYNGKPTSGEGANRLSVGEEINIPRDISDLVEERQESEQSDRDRSEEEGDDGSNGFQKAKTSNLTPQEKRALATANNGLSVDNLMLGPDNGVYSPLQPPGLEPGQTGDYDTEGWLWENYDVEGRLTLSEITDAKTGMRTLTYSGQVDSGFGANGVVLNDTPYMASETINRKGIVTHREIKYQSSSVEMNFDDGFGNQVDAYVKSVRSDLDPSTGNYRTFITTADGREYYMVVNGQSGRVITDS